MDIVMIALGLGMSFGIGVILGYTISARQHLKDEIPWPESKDSQF